MSGPWRWGIAGTGHIADSFTRDLALVPGAEVVAVGSRSLDTAEAFAATFSDRRTMIYAVTAEGRSAHIKNA